MRSGVASILGVWCIVIVLTLGASTAAVFAFEEPAFEEPASRPADVRAEMATRRLTEVKRRVRAILNAACPDSSAAWEPWLDGVVAAAATLIAVGDLDGPLKRIGASPEQLRAFDHARESPTVRFGAAYEAIEKVDECAALLGLSSPPPRELIERVYDRADVEKQREAAALGLAELSRRIKRP